MICSLLLIAFLLFIRIEEESLPISITISKIPNRKHLAVLGAQNLSTPSHQFHVTKSSEYEPYMVNHILL